VLETLGWRWRPRARARTTRRTCPSPPRRRPRAPARPTRPSRTPARGSARRTRRPTRPRAEWRAGPARCEGGPGTRHPRAMRGRTGHTPSPQSRRR
jgi:hypothetical protein